MIDRVCPAVFLMLLLLFFGCGSNRPPLASRVHLDDIDVDLILVGEGRLVTTLPYYRSNKLPDMEEVLLVGLEGETYVEIYDHYGEVEITKPYYMSATEISNSTYAAFVSATGYNGAHGYLYRFMQHNYDDDLAEFRGDDKPVVCVSASDAQAFCAWLTEKTGMRCRLPTAVEWEYVAYTAPMDPRSLAAYGGIDEVVNYGWFNVNSSGQVHDCATLRPNEWGFYDCLGNVAEWTSTESTSVPNNLESELPEVPATDWLVVRGGSYLNNVVYPATNDNSWQKDVRLPDVGFRVVAEP